MFKNKKLLTGIISTIIVLAIAIGGYFGYQSYKDNQTEEGTKTVTVTIINDNQVKTYEYETEVEFLGELLDEENLIEAQSSTYGRFITGVDGRQADGSVQEWWQIFINEKAAEFGIDDQAISDNDRIYIVLTTGYDG